MNTELIQHIQSFLADIPEQVTVEAAAKTRTAEQVRAAIHAGVTVIGYNYVQEAEKMRSQITEKASWHLIGHLQKNKVKRAVELFDLIETIDSLSLAASIHLHCQSLQKVMPILIEVNSGAEPNKTGVYPEHVERLVRSITDFPHVRILGLMTMGPWNDDPEQLRPYFRLTKEIYEYIRSLKITGVEMKILSMGMSDSYHIAIEEGANLVRLGTCLFGPRQ